MAVTARGRRSRWPTRSAEPGDGDAADETEGVTDVVWLPDSETNWLFLLMQADPDLRLVGVTREGHACSMRRVCSRAAEADDADPKTPA